jgi:hypothetical protein
MRLVQSLGLAQSSKNVRGGCSIPLNVIESRVVKKKLPEFLYCSDELPIYFFPSAAEQPSNPLRIGMVLGGMLEWIDGKEALSSDFM